MIIAGLQKLTLLDFPGYTAATVFLPGCNFRCPFCHNGELVVGNNFEEAITQEAFFAFLDTRKGLLDGVCITGGEPLLQPDIANFCRHIKQAGFAVKLDTNGSFPGRLRELAEACLVDYVAMDVKNAEGLYPATVGLPALDLVPLRESISYLLTKAIPYEFRTTVVRELHPVESLVALAHEIRGTDAWYLHNFVDTDTVLAGEGNLHAYTPKELSSILAEVKHIVPAAALRGISLQPE